MIAAGLRGRLPSCQGFGRRQVRRIVVDEADKPDDLSGGRWLLRAMSEQSERAHAFNRQMRWFRLRGRPVDLTPVPEVVVLPEADQEAVDLTATAGLAVPRQRC
jgi:hypothetical protein